MLIERWRLNNEPKDTAFDEYLNCTLAKPARKNFTSVLPEGAKFTLVVPWPVPQSTRSWNWYDTSTSPYFTRSRAKSIDCRSLRVESKDQGNAPAGFKALDKSIAEENFADPETPGIVDHQCVTVCEGGSFGEACYFGSVVWMAHDLRGAAVERTAP